MNKNRQFKINWFNNTIFASATLALCLMTSGINYVNAAPEDGNPVSISQLINQKKVTLNISNKPLKYILDEVKRQSGIGFVLSDNILDEKLNSLSIKVDGVTVKQALETLLKNTGYESVIVDNVITIVKKKGVAESPKGQQQTSKITIEGRVVDGEDHKSITGATVIVKGTTNGAITDMNGSFEFTAEEGQTLEISFVGMHPQEVKIVKGKPITIVLKKDAMVMDDVVVTGFNDVKSSSYTGNAVVVKRDELLKASKTNVIKALQTFDPSFRIKENNRWGSDPNALPEVSIRGESGIGVKQMDRDGLSKSTLKDNPNLPTFIMDGFEISATTLYDYDPNRIESITILKDAAATALYGSRAANGVVVITTVVPKPGKLNVSYNFVADITSPDLSDYNLLNAAEKLEVERQAGFYDKKFSDGYTTEYSLQKEYNNKLANVREGVETDWLAKPLQSVFNHKHSLYVDGGNENLRFGIDFQYANQDGVMKGSLRDKISAGVYVQYNFKTLTIKNKVTYNSTTAKDSPYGNFANFSKQLPYDKYQDENGRYLEEMTYWGTGTNMNKVNPLYEPSLHNFNETKSDELINNLSLNWKITPDLLLKGQLSLTKNSSKNDRFYDPLSKQSGNLFPLDATNMSSGTYYITNDNGSMVDLSANLSYFKTIKDHSINILAGFNLQEGIDNNDGITYIGFPSGILSSPMYAEKIHEKGTFYESKQRMVGFLASLNYSFRDTYMVDASIRVDGSSSFGSDKRFAPFWSFGAGINLHQYDFIKNAGIFDLLKIRGSYGQTGKADFPAYAARTSYEVLTDQWYKTGYGATLIALGNSNLKWETTNTFDIGAEIMMFKNLIYVKGSYYNKLTIDMINDVTVPTSTGFTSYRDNIGEISNKGYEFDVRIAAIRKKDFNLFINANLAHNKNRIEKISESLKAYNNRVKEQFDKQYNWDDPEKALTTQPFIQYEEGGSTSSIWGVRSLGINPADGNEVYVSRTGRTARVWNSSDQVVMGTTEPDAQGSLGFNLTYKQFSLYTSFMYEFGGQRYNQTLVDKVENVNVYADNVDKRVFEERWKTPGQNAKYKSIKVDRNGPEATKPTSRFVQDYNILSWNSIELGYDFSSKITSKLHMSMLRLTIGMNDILHLTSVEMERGLDYPYARSVNFSLKASF